MLLTRCPSCRTAFRVTPEQLKARAGKVRCGHCNAVFNALETLDALPNGGSGALGGSSGSGALAAKEPSEIRGEAPLPPEAPFPLEAPSPQEAPLLREAAPPQETPPPAEGSPEPEDEEADLAEAAPAARNRRPVLAWSLALLLMAAALGLQAAYVFRAELAAAQPQLRPMLEEWCAALGCDVPLPRTAELASIEASDLHPDPKQPNLLVLAATLKNRAPFVQAYPYLELTLTDTRDQPLARRVFAPEDYLANGAQARTGFAANAELAVGLWLDAAGVGATGYRLYLFYP